MAEPGIGRSAAEVDPALPEYPTMIHALARAVELAGERVALVCEDRQLTYREYARAVAGFADLLRGMGAAGGRVAVLLGNSLEMSVACTGVMAAGAEVAPFNPNFTDREMMPLMQDVSPRIIVSDAARAERALLLAAELPGDCRTLVLGPGGHEIDLWAADPDLALAEPFPRPDDPAIMFFTGGTTGVPKGARHRHGAIVTSCRLHLSLWRMHMDEERILTVAPLFHIWGNHFANFIPLYLRATLVMLPQYKPEAVLEQISRHRITVFAGGPPALYFGLLANERFADTDFSSLWCCLSGGAPCPEELHRTWMDKTGCPLLEGTGMSEGAPIACNPTHGERRLMSVGLPPPLTEVDVVDLETGTKVLGPGERGEIRVRGPQFTYEYCNRPDETAHALRDGWLYTGDIGQFDEDGYLYLVDRKKEMILVGGYNVYPREIDQVLFSHPAVHEAAAVGVPDDFRGEVVKAFVSLKAGAELDEEMLMAYCAERLVGYKRPVAIEFLDALPKTAANKIDKLALKGQR